MGDKCHGSGCCFLKNVHLYLNTEKKHGDNIDYLKASRFLAGGMIGLILSTYFLKTLSSDGREVC